MSFEKREYQEQTIDLVLKNIYEKKAKKILINSPTGSGKTVIATKIIEDLIKNGKKIFFVVANEPLIMQTYNKFIGIGIFPSIIKAKFEKFYNPDRQVQIVMIQSYTARQDKIPDLETDVIIIDEVDFGYNGNMLKNLIKKHGEASIVGLTGTPINIKGHLLDGFELYHEVITVRELQERGYLSNDKNYIPATPDLSNVRVMTTGDFNEADLDQACSESFFIADIVETYKKNNCGYKGIVFAISIGHGEKLQRAFCEAGIRTGLVHSKMKKFQVDYAMDSHKRGVTQLLVNVGKLTRGYDDVDIIDVIMARPTESLALYLQMVGRAARPDKNGLMFFRHFDYAGNIERHGLWSEPRLYSKDDEVKKEYEFSPIVCPSCFSVIYEKGNTCPECDFILKQQQERREREIQETLRTNHIIEIKSETGSNSAINALTNLLGYNGNTFYYTKLFNKKPLHIPNEAFNSEVIRISNNAKRKGYHPYYVVNQVLKKCLTN